MESIEFHTGPPRYYTADPTPACTASVDGMLAYYVVTTEALGEHFDAHLWRQENLFQAVESYRGTTKDMAHPLFGLTGLHSIVLRGGHFRFGIQLFREQHDRRLHLRRI